MEEPAVIQFELDADVPASRVVTLTLPPETPTGPVRLVLAVEHSRGTLPPEWPYCRPPDPLGAEYDAFCGMFSELLAAHRDEYVAVYGGRVVASGPTLDGVSKAVLAAHGDVPAYIAAVHDGFPEIRIGRIDVLDSETPP